MNKDIDYSKLKKITVRSQAELDGIPTDFRGKILINFGTYANPAIVRRNYKGLVTAVGDSFVLALGGDLVTCDHSYVCSYNSFVDAYDYSFVDAHGGVCVNAHDYSCVKARDYSCVVANGNAQVINKLNSKGDGVIITKGNARVLNTPTLIQKYCNFYEIEYDEKKGKFYKAVHKNSDINSYFSDFDNTFEYRIGEKVKVDFLDTDTGIECGRGIHIAHKNWCLRFGESWRDLAILEVEAELDRIVIPKYYDGKLRCDEVTVLREVPLRECGLLGKFLSGRRNYEC